MQPEDPKKHLIKHVRKGKYESDKESDTTKSGKFIIIAIVVIVAIIVSAILISKYFFKDTNTIEYNNYVFERFEGNKWMTQQMIKGQLYNIPFYYNPTEVLDIPVDPNAILKVRNFSANPNGTLYITVDPYESSKVVLAGVEYARILGTGYNIYNINVKSGLSQSVDIMTESPVITCDDQNENTFIIYQKVSDKNLVSIKDNCVIIESKNINESIRVADAYSFRLLNIIKDW
jgi:hypothetical protein